MEDWVCVYPKFELADVRNACLRVRSTLRDVYGPKKLQAEKVENAWATLTVFHILFVVAMLALFSYKLAYVDGLTAAMQDSLSKYKIIYIIGIFLWLIIPVLFCQHRRRLAEEKFWEFIQSTDDSIRYLGFEPGTTMLALYGEDESVFCDKFEYYDSCREFYAIKAMLGAMDCQLKFGGTDATLDRFTCSMEAYCNGRFHRRFEVRFSTPEELTKAKMGDFSYIDDKITALNEYADRMVNEGD